VVWQSTEFTAALKKAWFAFLHGMRTVT